MLFGGTTIVTKISAGTNEWRARGRIFRTGAATQDCQAEILFAGAAYDGHMNFVTATETLSGAVTIKVTAVGVADNDIIQHTFIVGWDDANT